MRATLRRAALSFLTGFIVSFILYLFVRFDVDAVVLGVIIGAAGGAVTTAAVLYIFRRMAQDDARTASTPPDPRATPR